MAQVLVGDSPWVEGLLPNGRREFIGRYGRSVENWAKRMGISKKLVHFFGIFNLPFKLAPGNITDPAIIKTKP